MGMTRFGAHLKFSDDELVELIRRNGVLSSDDLKLCTGYHQTSLHRRMKLLVASSRVTRFSLQGSGKNPGSVLPVKDLFDGLAYRTRLGSTFYFYVDEDRAFEFLVGRLQLSPSLSWIVRKRLSHFLRSGVSSTLFRRLHAVYSANPGTEKRFADGRVAP